MLLSIPKSIHNSAEVHSLDCTYSGENEQAHEMAQHNITSCVTKHKGQGAFTLLGKVDVHEKWLYDMPR